MDQIQPLTLLKQTYGYDSFRPGQSQIIETILAGRDCLAVMPTGAGKSLCFQIPAMLLAGITLVISPLVSLMRDQVMGLAQNGVPAAFINSSLTPAQMNKAIERAANGAYKIIYVTPERLDTPQFTAFAREAAIAMIAVDEAHCVSHWGQDFRPSYLNIAAFTQSLPNRPVVAAFTATATDAVRADMIRLLCLQDPFSLATGFNRENLFFEVRRPRNKYAELAAFLRKNKDKSGIVYCATRKAVEEVTDRLNADHFNAARYHAGMSQAERTAAQEHFVYDRVPVMVATNAFGMGIDKSNVAFVVHYNMPKNMESYYQEAGRAGRDGSPAECVLLFGRQDVVINKFLIEQTDPESPLDTQELAKAKARDYKRLRLMEGYCATTNCLRQTILDYFGDQEEISCGNCGNCNAEHKRIDVTTDAQKILSAIYRMNGRFGIMTTIDVLRGAKTERIRKADLDQLKTYGVMAEQGIAQIRALADFLIDSGYIAVTGDQYPLVETTKAADTVLFQGDRVMMPVIASVSDITEDEAALVGPARAGRAKKGKKRTGNPLSANPALFNRLKKLRLRLAAAEGVPAFVIFSDATLFDMCAKMPADADGFLNVTGVGQIKLDKYGQAFLEEIRTFATDTGAEVSKTILS